MIMKAEELKRAKVLKRATVKKVGEALKEGLAMKKVTYSTSCVIFSCVTSLLGEISLCGPFL